MRVALWDRSIEIRLGSGDHFACVSNSLDALRYLMTEWPVSGGKSFSTARGACIGALNGKVPASVALTAFESAARDAEILR